MERGAPTESVCSCPSSIVKLAAISVYIPPTVVSQDEVSDLCKIPLEKITQGLGQYEMSVTMDSEDSVSLALNALQLLIDDKVVQDILSEATIGRIEVGTESSVDKAKSIKSFLVDIIGINKTTGADVINACLGGVLALENAISWLSTSKFNDDSKKYSAAIVITSDISVYDNPASLPTGGAGAIAMLLLKGYHSGIECSMSFSSYWENTTDFYKPHIASPVPKVQGSLSIECYLRANLFAAIGNEQQRRLFIDADYTCFHTPYCALPRKIHALLCYVTSLDSNDEAKLLESIKSEDSNVLSLLSKNCLTDYSILNDCEQRCSPSLKLSSRTGNIYTGSIFLALVSILEHIEGFTINKNETSSTASSRLGSILPKESYAIYASGYGSGMGSISFKLCVYTKSMPRILRTKRVAALPSEHMLQLSIKSNKRLLMYKLSYDPLVQEFLQDRFHQQVVTEPEEYVTVNRMHFSHGEWYLDRIDCDGVRHYERWLDKPNVKFGK